MHLNKSLPFASHSYWIHPQDHDFVWGKKKTPKHLEKLGIFYQSSVNLGLILRDTIQMSKTISQFSPILPVYFETQQKWRTASQASRFTRQCPGFLIILVPCYSGTEKWVNESGSIQSSYITSCNFCVFIYSKYGRTGVRGAGWQQVTEDGLRLPWSQSTEVRLMFTAHIYSDICSFWSPLGFLICCWHPWILRAQMWAFASLGALRGSSWVGLVAPSTRRLFPTPSFLVSGHH